jgi:hypothetical protein
LKKFFNVLPANRMRVRKINTRATPRGGDRRMGDEEKEEKEEAECELTFLSRASQM